MQTLTPLAAMETADLATRQGNDFADSLIANDGCEFSAQANVDIDDAPNIITVDGYLIDTSTGECVGVVAPPRFEVTDTASAEWVLERMQEADFDIAGLEARKAALVANMDKLIKAKRSRREYLEARFGAGLRDFAAKMLENAKSRTWTCPFGAVAFKRKAGGAIKVLDQAKAVDWIARNLPDDEVDKAIKTTYTVLVTPLKGMDLPGDIFEVSEPSETFEIKTGPKGSE